MVDDQNQAPDIAVVTAVAARILIDCHCHVDRNSGNSVSYGIGVSTLPCC